MFNHPSILIPFHIGVPEQIASDFKVAALLVGVLQAQNRYPCLKCLWRKGDPCTGMPAKARESKSNSIVNRPIIQWKESLIEVLALAPLHIFIGPTYRLYFAARPSETIVTKESRQLYKRHCLALLKAKVYKFDYLTGAL